MVGRIWYTKLCLLKFDTGKIDRDWFDGGKFDRAKFGREKMVETIG